MRARKAAQVHLLDFLGSSSPSIRRRIHGAEERVLTDLCRPYTLGRFSDCLELYASELAPGFPGAPSLDEVIARLGGQALMERIRVERSRRIATRPPWPGCHLMEASRGETLAERIDDLLGWRSCRAAWGSRPDPHRVNLLTLHSTKGLEFSRVYIVGVEDQQMPGWKAHPGQRAGRRWRKRGGCSTSG